MAINSTGIDACAPEDCSSCTADCSSRVDLKTNVIELTTDEGEVIRCQVLLNYEMEGRRYLAVMPLADNPDGDIYLFRVAEGETGLENIEDEEEHSRAAHAFGDRDGEGTEGAAAVVILQGFHWMASFRTARKENFLGKITSVHDFVTAPGLSPGSGRFFRRPPGT